MMRAAALERLPMTLGYFRLILRTFGDTPARRAAILEGTGVSERDLASPGAEISLFQQIRQIENVARVHGEGWPFQHPEIWRPMSHGALGIAVTSAPTLAEGIAVLQRFAHVRAPFFRVHVVRRGGLVRVERENVVPLTKLQERALNEAANVSVHAMIARVTGRAPDELIWSFTNPKPPYVATLIRVLGPHLRFNEKRSAVSIPAAWLDAPSPMADPALFRAAVAELERALDRLERPRDLKARVVRLLHTMPDGKMSADDAARVLAVSKRTLVRRLAEAETTYRDLLEDELKRRAAALLRGGHLRRDAIAERLGYRDPTSFSRACKRWFGPKTGARRKRVAGR
jgi:AraC-like DNA-binding protein